MYMFYIGNEEIINEKGNTKNKVTYRDVGCVNCYRFRNYSEG